MAFESLTEKLQNVFKKLRGKGRLTAVSYTHLDVYKRQGLYHPPDRKTEAPVPKR